MDLSLLELQIFGLTLDNFMIVWILIVIALIVTGIVLMAKNIRPILGFLLLILAIAMVIGISYDTKGIKREFRETLEKITK